MRSYVEGEDAAEKQLRQLMERRRAGGGDQKSIEATWKLSDQRRAQLEKEQNRELWLSHHLKMHQQFSRLAQDHLARARQLEEGDGNGHA